MIHPPSDCSRCGLCQNRTNIVLPTGNLNSEIVFVGEAPGKNEDLQGTPFIGSAGKILDDVMRSAGISRSDIMITNTVKCRPFNNRDPTKEEMMACRPYLNSEMKGRKLIVGLGKSSIRNLMGYECRMSKVVNTIVKIEVEGEFMDFLPTYHPMACIYMSEAKKHLLETMKIVKRLLG
ncbi:MAG: uracil-DNA glycosylase [archaeon]|nr:uracil-DNA glycosylase [archaeon]